MSSFQIIIERNKRKFSQSQSQLEIKFLNREKSHLTNKANERSLTSWERERLQQLEQELSAIAARMQPATKSMPMLLQCGD